MPGLWGGIGCKPERYEELQRWFVTVWGKCENFSAHRVFLGGHAHGDASSLYSTGEELYFVVDGESSIYRSASRFVRENKPSLFQFKDNRFQPTVYCKGNIVIYGQNKNELHLLTECTGLFPLYYAQVDNGIIFSSHLKPLAKAIGAKPDPVGIIEFMRYGYILAGRTHFKGIRRLLPGQCIEYKQIHNHLRIYETSRAWTKLVDGVEFKEIPERVWHVMGNALYRCLEASEQYALMTSAGWDSRLLFAGIREYMDISRFQGFSHGDLQSREIAIAAKIFNNSNIKYHLEPLTSSLFDLGFLQQGFTRVENVIFPFWHRAGACLSEAGVHNVSAGVFGEVIGGHNCMSLLLGSSWDKMFFVASQVLGLKTKQFSEGKQNTRYVYNFLHLDYLNKPWYVREDYWRSITSIKELINADIKESLHRLESRGVKNGEQLIESYITEFLACHNWGSQLLNCHAYLDINNVFGDQELFNLASSIPLSIKVHNSLNRAILGRYAPDLLRFPTAAILAPVRFPMIVQEATRILRKALYKISWEMNFLTQGIFKPRFLGWDNFEFLRNGKMFKILIDDIKNDIVDKNIIEEFVSKIVRRKTKEPLFNVSNQFMKIYTTDLMLR